MAISAVALADSIGYNPGDPVFHYLVTLSLDASYPTGGYAGFNATLLTAIGKGKTIQVVDQQNFPGTVKHIMKYNNATDKLQAFVYTTGVEAANTTDLSSMTGLKLLVIAK